MTPSLPQRICLTGLLPLLLMTRLLFAQSYEALDRLSVFRNPSSSWQEVAEVWGMPREVNLESSPGRGVLLCAPKNRLYRPEDHLITQMEHGDLDLSLEVMIPAHSNSGIYLQGRYEIQVADSWGKVSPSFSDAGGVYQRWDEVTGKGYGGHAPRFNAAKAPGLWNHIRIRFQAPRFDAAGRKTSDAMLLLVTWNGLVIHENVPLSGPTRAAAYSDEKPTGPLLFQGDHGPVAYRHIRLTRMGNPDIRIVPPVKYAIYENAITREQKGAIQSVPKAKDLTMLTPVKTGETALIDVSMSRRGTQYYLLTGQFEVPDPGLYAFKANYHGYARVEIDGQLLLSDEALPWYGLGFNEEMMETKQLSAGRHSFRIGYTHRDWDRHLRALALYVRAGAKEGNWQALHDKKSEMEFSRTVMHEVIPGNQSVFQRSFVNFDSVKRTHAINVGFPEAVHYSYDTRKAAILYVWRGRFLNTTEMWFDRGTEQTAEPLGMTQRMSGLFPVLDLDGNPTPGWDSLRYLGMNIEGTEGRKAPRFSYQAGARFFKDWLEPGPNNQGLTRHTEFASPVADQSILVATAKKGFRKLADGSYSVDDAAWYILVPSESNPRVVENPGGHWLICSPTGVHFSYQIIF